MTPTREFSCEGRLSAPFQINSSQDDSPNTGKPAANGCWRPTSAKHQRSLAQAGRNGDGRTDCDAGCRGDQVRASGSGKGLNEVPAMTAVFHRKEEIDALRKPGRGPGAEEGYRDPPQTGRLPGGRHPAKEGSFTQGHCYKCSARDEVYGCSRSPASSLAFLRRDGS